MSVPEVWWSNGVARIADALTARGCRRIGVITTPGRRHLDRVTVGLAAFEVVVFDGAVVHVPAEVVQAAGQRLADVDAIVAVGGGSAIGLAKALRLERPKLTFVAVPTTYAASEMTTMFGITSGAEKKTGRNPAVRPDFVAYDAELTRDMPLALTVQSLCNALAHVISALSTGSLQDAARSDALAAAGATIHAIEDLLLAPRAVRPREHALRAASACGTAFDRGRAGVQHGLAHLLGGALRVDHAPLHAILLPHVIAHLRTAQPELVAEIEHAIWPAEDRPDLEPYLHDTLVRAGAPVALTALSQQPIADAVRTALATKPELPAAIVDDAMHGLRPPGALGRVDLGSVPHAVVLGCPLDRATTIVLALHGRGAEAGTIARRYLEIAGHDPHTAIVGLRAEAGAPRWYEVKYGQPGAGTDPEVVRTIARVEVALATLAEVGPGRRIVLAGFSQGACLALEVAARTQRRIDAVLAPCGARIGQPAEWSARSGLDGLRVLAGAAAGDKWIARADLDATIAWFREAGAVVDDLSGPGDKHEITLRQRIRARDILRGEAVPARGATGFGNAVTSEARPGAVPALQNSPRQPPFGLYPEQLNGTGFTAERAHNHRTWLYRVRPSTQRTAGATLAHPTLTGTFDAAPAGELFGLPPLALPDQPRDFVDGLFTVCGAGSAALRRGYAFHLYAANRSMEQRAFYNADGDLLIIPELGTLTLVTELGPLEVAPGSIALVPRGIAFSVVVDGDSRGYVAEPFGRQFRLPERGPIGANGLADPRHFQTATAWFEDRLQPDTRVVGKLGGVLHEARQDHSPFDVVGWHGSHLPWVYDLAMFSPSGNVRFDHGDPSVFTVLTAPLDEPGAHALDFVLFPPRIDATLHTFRPPFFHRNTVSEINGIVREHAPAGSPFVAGCTFVTPCLVPHGVSGRAIEQSRAISDRDADRPTHLDAGLWFQFESILPPVVTPWAAAVAREDWPATWGSHRRFFR